VSEASANELIHDFGTNIKGKNQIIYNGLEISKFVKKNIFETNSNFIVACHLREQKGVQDLINAVAIIKDKTSGDFRIDIFGEGNYEAKLKELVTELCLQDIFSFKGSVFNLEKLYCQYDYLIHPSHGETFCYTVVESLLSNLPVITTNNHGNVLGLIKNNENGFLYEVENKNQLSEILLDILDGKKRISDPLATNNDATNLSLKKMVENYSMLLDNNY
jgi:glycosyltransferase involved in cell wall biosynthesis